jgi:hypothetical protein
VIEDVVGSAGWRAEWRALPRRTRSRLLTELRRAEIVHGPSEALLVLRAARRLHRTAPWRIPAVVLGILLGQLASGILLPFLTPVPLDRGIPLRAVGVLAAVTVWMTWRERRRLARGIDKNAAALRHWVEHAHLPGPGPLPPEAAARLLRIIADEGWTRPHR